ncbi:branched-chain amino acid ABC transporter substrate-binding protein [Herbaspirillum robiniae]|uniref:branched-chain amino acid ABC transporter substrate-binding protein n=1 Tax=Herbaspirillum robiniae TaxID=2014887 RepID=UPI003D771CD5
MRTSIASRRAAHRPFTLFHLAVLAGALSLLLPGAVAAEDVVIGWAGPEQQPHARALKQGVELAIAEANERGLTVQGRRLSFKLLAYNDSGNPNVAPFAARSLVAGKAVAVIGHYTTETTIAGAQVYAETGVPELAVFAPSPRLTQLGYKNVFQLIGNIADATAYMATAVAQMDGGKRVAVAYNGSIMGATVADAVDREMQKHGTALAGRVSISARTSDFNAVLKMLDGGKADILYFAGIQEQALALSQRLRGANLTVQLMLSGGAFNPHFYANAGGYGEGTLLMAHNRPESQQPGFPRFEKAYVARFHAPVMPYVANAYDATGMVIEAIRRGGSVEPATISATLHAMSYDGVTGRIAFDADGRLENPSYTLYEVSQKKWKVVRSFP